MTSTRQNTHHLLQILFFSCFGLFSITSYSFYSYADSMYDNHVDSYIMNNYINKHHGDGVTGNNQSNNNQIKPSQEQKLIYQYSSDTHNLVRQRTINYFDTLPNGSTLADYLRKTDVVEIYRKDIPKLGFDKNSVTDADAYLWLQAWQAIHYTDETTITPEVIEAVRRQFRAIGIVRKLHELQDGFKQIYAEARITQAMLILSLQRLALNGNDQTAVDNMIQAARGSVEGIDGFKLTNKGFEAKKETLTSEGAQLTDVYFNRLSSVSITKSVTQQSNVASTLVVVKTSNDQWYQRHADGSFSTWDLQLTSLKNNNFSANSDDVVFFDIAASLDLSSAPVLFPLTVYIGNNYDNGQLNWGYFNVKPL